jgi:hypothetical protein
MTAITDIIDSIENRLRELNDEIGALNAARDALDGHHAQAPRRRRGAASSRTRTGPSAGGAGAVHAAGGAGAVHAAAGAGAVHAAAGASAVHAAGGASAVHTAGEPGGSASTAPPRPSPSMPRKPARRKARAKPDRTAKVVRAGELELLLSDTGGLATSTLAERANTDRDQVLTLLRELEVAGRVRRTGQRRATRWHAITDEERIQERAAELTARSRSAA